MAQAQERLSVVAKRDGSAGGDRSYHAAIETAVGINLGNKTLHQLMIRLKALNMRLCKVFVK